MAEPGRAELDGVEVLAFAAAAAFEAWLAEHHGRQQGLWLTAPPAEGGGLRLCLGDF
jgi:hypothetical protein